MSHQCPRKGCTRIVGDRMLMCGPDWRRVDPALQRAVYAAYRRGAGLGSDELAEAQDAAIRAVNGESEPRPTMGQLWDQAGEDPGEYRRLLREHKYTAGPGDEGHDPDASKLPPCGRSPS